MDTSERASPECMRVQNMFVKKCVTMFDQNVWQGSNFMKHNQTRTNNTKQGLNRKMFGHQTMFHHVQSPNISCLDGA